MISTHCFNIELSRSPVTCHNKKKWNNIFTMTEIWTECRRGRAHPQSRLISELTLVMFPDTLFYIWSFWSWTTAVQSCLFYFRSAYLHIKCSGKTEYELHHTEESGQLCRNKNNSLVRMHTHNFNTQHHENGISSFLYNFDTFARKSITYIFYYFFCWIKAQ